MQRPVMKSVGAIAVGVLMTATGAAASPIVFDNSSRQDFTSGRSAGNSPLAAITVAAPTAIDQIGVFTDLTTSGNLKFLIFDLGTNALLFSTAQQAFLDDGLNFKLSDPFAAFTLMPGVTYGIGAIADVGGSWGTNNSSSGSPFTQNGITASDDLNGNVMNFGSPALGAGGTAMIIVELAGGTAGGPAVPEPSSLLLLGAGVLTGLRRLKR